AFDGTGNDANKDPAHATNVANVRDQIEALNRRGNHKIGVGYVPGPGTQDAFLAKSLDGMRGHTYDERLEQMYKQFIDQVARWRKDDPNVEIRIAAIGFSRGGEQAAGFTRLVHERGIHDATGAVYTYDNEGQIKGIKYNNPPFVAPGQVAQAVGLFDPVGTGEPIKDHDRRLPPSVISGFQIKAEDERRGLFKSSHIIDQGMTPDRRFLGVTVGGAHSNIGNSYHRDGLGIRNGNLMADFLNALSDKPFIEKRFEPDDPRRNVVHRSEEGMVIYRVGEKVDRLKPEGYVELLVPESQRKKVRDPFNAEPRDESLNQHFERKAVPIGPVPPMFLPIIQPPSDPEKGQTDEKGPLIQREAAPQPIALPPIPDLPRDFRDSHHLQHLRYQRTLQAVHVMEDQRNIPHGPTSERVAATLVDHMHKAGFQELARVELRGDGPDARIVAVQTQHTP
ncbi:MAG: DUF2235 domain-containing protein, partial [Telluria sp.]